MSRPALVAVADDDPDAEERGERVLVLVDGSREATRALQSAMRLSDQRRALLTIVAYAPGPVGGDAESLRVERLLVAAQAEAEVAGVAAERCLLHGPNPLQQLHALLAPSDDLLVLCSPTALDGALRPLARSLLRTPPCSLYVLPAACGRLARLRLKAIGWLARRGAAREVWR